MVLDGIQIDRFDLRLKRMIEKLINLTHLSMNGCGLVTLGYLPRLVHLERLEIDFNKLDPKELIKLRKYQKMRFLSFKTRFLSKPEQLKFLNRNPKL